MRLAKRAFANTVCRLASKGSIFRSLLVRAWLVVDLRGDLYHIALQYLNPRRPTFIKLQRPGDLAWGRERVEPKFHEDGCVECGTDIEAMLFS